MTPLFRRLMRNEKGGASVAVATVMAMVIAVSFVTNILVWGNRLQLEEEQRLAEKFTIKSVFLSNQTTVFQANVFVENSGGVLIRFVSLYIDTTRYSIDVFIDPARTTTIVQDLTSNPEIDDFETSFGVTLVTERGLTGYFQYTPEPPEGVKETGVFRIDWFYFQYTSDQQRTRKDAMVIPQTSDYVAIYFKITNNWIYPTKIKAETFVTWIVPYIEVTMSIVDHVTYSPRSITAYTNEIILQPGQTAEIIFAATTRGGTSWVWGSNIPSNLITDNPSNTASLQVTLFYRLFKGSVEYNYVQTLSAQGTYLAP